MQLDFVKIKTRDLTSNNRKSDIQVYPDFIYAGVKDIVCKGGAMYAFWTGQEWSMSKDDLILAIDSLTMTKVRDLQTKYPEKSISAQLMNDAETKIMQKFETYCKSMQQSNAIFNERIMFEHDVMQREDYATNKLTYSPEKGETPAFDELLELLYDPKELEKILWFAGALLTNNMTNIQKFMFLYGGKGSGKGTVIKVFKMLFDGYHSPIDLRTLTSDGPFATSQVKEVPLLIDEDSDISKISKDTNLLKLTAHEPITVNVKYKDTYETIFNGLLITASNQRFQVRNVDSGITRRAVVVEPTSLTHSSDDYFRLIKLIPFELPHIAQKCIDVFIDKGAFYYENYMDVDMAEATDHIYSFVRENAWQLGEEVSLTRASELYKLYLEDIGFDTRGYKRKIKSELQRYYRHFYSRGRNSNGDQVRNLFVGFKEELVFPEGRPTVEIDDTPLIELGSYPEVFLEYAKDYPAQLTTKDGTPKQKWDEVLTTLKDIPQEELHFVKVPYNHIVIDFDLKDDTGEKSLELNLEAASQFPKTYTEVSKSGQGIHLHYTYGGDIGNLALEYSDGIEIKKFTGGSSLRRKYTRSNNEMISHISAGLPYKEREGVKVYDNLEEIVWNEKKIRTSVIGNLEKKYHSATKPSIDFIAHILKEAEEAGVKYDIRDLKQKVITFALNSTNNKDYCLKVVKDLNFTTINNEEDATTLQQGGRIIPKEDLYFYDVEVYPNLFVIVYKKYGGEATALVNPTPEQVENIMRLPLVGFNNRRYDNHILYGAMLGKDNMELYKQSQTIVNGNPGGFYSGAYEASYVDIYEYSTKKQSLKKWEIELDIKHDEMEIPWDQPVADDMVDRVVEYCINDVNATEEVFKATEADFDARIILAELSGLNPNATTQQHAAKIIFGDDPKPQEKFVYTDLATEFPGYKYEFGKSSYLGEDPSEGGYVYSEPGVYEDVVLLDIVSMHPTSAINLNIFGPYTKNFAELKQARVYVKHRDFEKAGEMLGGVLKPYLKEETADALAYALKIVINIIYGMTSAKFPNAFKDPKNIDNIVAKRGALFMIKLKQDLQAMGAKVCHVKTDSIKLVKPTKEQLDYVYSMADEFKYEFEHEATYSRMALVNKSVYIAQYGWADKESKIGKWEAIGAQFAMPYVYKTLFTGEELEDKDFFITKQVKSALYLGDNFIGKVANIYASKTGYNCTRFNGEKHDAVTGTKGYLWKLASEFSGTSDIDMKYYNDLDSDAITAIQKVGDIHTMFSEETLTAYFEDYITDDDLPF